MEFTKLKVGDRVICKILGYPAHSWGVGTIKGFDDIELQPSRINSAIRILFDSGSTALLFENEITKVDEEG